MRRQLLARLSWLAFLTLLGVLARVTWARTDDTVHTAQWVAFWTLAAAAAAAGWAAGLRPDWPGSPLRAPLLGLAAGALLLPAAAFRASTGVMESLGWLAALAVVAGSVWWLGSEHRIRKAGLALLIVHLLVTLHTFMQYFGLERTRWAFGFGGNRPFATLGNPNYLAGEFAGPLVVAAGLCLAAPSAGMRLPWQLLTLAWAGVILVAQTRASWAAALLGLGWLGWRWWAEDRDAVQRQRSWLTAWGAAAALLGVLAMLANPELALRVESLVHPEFGQVAKRVAAWRTGMLAWRERPLFGFGPGNFRHAHGKHMARGIPEGEEKQFIHTYSEQFAHNDFIQLLTETGAAGTGLFLWAAVAAWAALRRSPDRALARALEAAAVAVAAHGAFNQPLQVAPTALLCAVWLGLAARPSTGLRASPEPGRGARGGVCPAPSNIPAWRAAPAGLLALAAGTAAAAIFTASLYTRLGKDVMGMSRWRDAAHWFEQSRRIDWDDRRESFYAASMRFQSGDAAGSVPLFEDEIRRNPYYMDGYANLGSVLGSLRDLKGAERMLRRAIELNPAYAEAYANLGVAMLESKRFADAAELFAKALALEPELGMARSGLEQAQEKLKALRSRPFGNAQGGR